MSDVKGKIIKAPKKTGTLHFQFDDDDPIQISEVFDHAGFILELKSPTEMDPAFLQRMIEFDNGKGKVFRIFIRPEK